MESLRLMQKYCGNAFGGEADFVWHGRNTYRCNRLFLIRAGEGGLVNHTGGEFLRLRSGYGYFMPPELDLEFDSIWKQVQAAKEKNQLDEEDAEKTEEELREEYRSIAERRVRLGLLLAEVGMKNKITVTDADLNRAIMMEARQFPGQEKAVFDFYSKHPEMLDRLRAPLFEEKVIDFILKAVKLNEKKVTPEELYKADAEEAKKPAKKAKKTAKAADNAEEKKPAKKTKAKTKEDTAEKTETKKTAKKTAAKKKTDK